MTPRLGSAVVVGAGTMGAQIACLLAGAGARVELLRHDQEIAAPGLERADEARSRRRCIRAATRAADPAGRAGRRGELEAAVGGADWVLEAIVEQLEPKRALFERIDAALTGTTRLVTTNTSGLSIGELAEGRSERSGAASWAPTSSTRRATPACSS